MNSKKLTTIFKNNTSLKKYLQKKILKDKLFSQAVQETFFEPHPPQKVLKLNKNINFLTNENNIYIGRKNRNLQQHFFHNPFKISNSVTREKACYFFIKYTLFCKHIKNDEKRKEKILNILQELNLLSNKNLVCYCIPKMCHGIILKLLYEIITEIK